MRSDVAQILVAIPELAHVALREGAVTYTPPLRNLCEFRCRPVLSYLSRYSSLRGFGGEYFLCLYDGWREYSAPSVNPIFVPWREVDAARFAGVGSEGEPRFLHRYADGIFPVLPLPVLAFCRHVGDVNTLLIPDASYLNNQFKPLCDQVAEHDIDWDAKDGRTLFWRGRRRTAPYPGQVHPHPRDFITSQTAALVNASYSADTPVAQQLQHKYLIDADGMVNAWSGLFWKLRSNSVPVKLKSHWEQWYYPLLQDGANLILSDLNLAHTYEKLIKDDDRICAIAQAGKKLASRLTYEFACEEYTIA